MMPTEKAANRNPSPAHVRRGWRNPGGGFDTPFWEIRLSALELFLLVAAAGLVAALHLDPVLHSAAHTPAVGVLAALSYLSPVSGFFFISCSQFLPFPEGAQFNPAQIGVLLWLPVVLVRYQGVSLRFITALWPVLPWLAWFVMMTGEEIWLPNSEYVKALIYAVIACQLANEAHGCYLKCLLGLCLGALMVMVAYWAFALGLPVQISDWGGEREGFVRMGSVRADAVMVWPALLVGVSGLLGLSASLASVADKVTMPRWLMPLSGVLVVAALPPLVATMTHSAYMSFGIMSAIFAACLLLTVNTGAIAQRDFKRLMTFLSVVAAAGGLLYIMNAFQIRSRATAMLQHYQESSEQSGWAASRSDVWRDALRTIRTYPLLGVRGADGEEIITSHYAESGGYLAHNVFLDYGRASGVPGMILCLFFFFWPSYRMWQTGDRVRYLPFLLAHLAMFIFWMSLSFQFYKTFWALWMLMAMTVGEAQYLRPAPNHLRRPRQPARASIGPTPTVP